MIEYTAEIRLGYFIWGRNLTSSGVESTCFQLKKSADNINSRLSMVMKTGKYVLGYKQTLKVLRYEHKNCRNGPRT